jgi:AcrR family transcriptional regulator
MMAALCHNNGFTMRTPADNPSTQLPNGKGRPRSQESEDAILDAVVHLLAKEGYGALTTDKIVARARTSKSTIYRRWPTKEHLVLAAFDRLPLLTPTDTGRLVDDLLDVMLQFVGFFDSTPMGGVLTALMAERVHNAELAAALEPVIDRRREPVKEIIRRAVARGELPGSTNLDLAEDLVMGPLLLRMFFFPGDVRKPALRALLATVVRGLAESKPAR